MRTVRVTLMVGLMMVLLCVDAAAQGARPSGGDSSAASGPWKQLAKLTESRGKEQDWLGWSVAVSKDGNTAAVGAVGWCPRQGFNGCGQGAIFVFVKPDSGWADMTETAILTASDGQPGEYLGESVAISDDGGTIVAGAPLWPANHTFMGAAYVFVRKPGGGWANMTETARLTSTDGDNVSVGQSVSIGGTIVVAGGFGFNTNQGAAYVFVQSKGGWANMTQTARLTPSDGKDASMGLSVSISGNTVVAGAPYTGIGGEGNGAYVFVKRRNGWKNSTETAKLTASHGTGLDLGYSVSISGGTIALGARRRSNDNGAVYVYVKPGQGWRSMTETARLTVPSKFNLLGYSVCADSNGKNIVGGAPGWQDGLGQGAVDFFVRSASGWKTTSKAKTRLIASDGMAKDSLGFSVSGGLAAIFAGSPYAAIGSNPQQGAAYVFGR
jgi:hypothetical protein